MAWLKSSWKLKTDLTDLVLLFNIGHIHLKYVMTGDNCIQTWGSIFTIAQIRCLGRHADIYSDRDGNKFWMPILVNVRWQSVRLMKTRLHCPISISNPYILSSLINFMFFMLFRNMISSSTCNVRSFLAATKQLYKWYFPSVFSSVRPYVCHTFLTMFPSSYHHEIFRTYYRWPK